MTERRLFVSAEDWSLDQIVVRGEQAHHLKDVLRAQAGDIFEFIDGQGRWARAVVESVPTRGEVKCRVQEQRVTSLSSEHRLILLQALVRFERFEWVLEKATELGVTQVIPLITAHTESKWREVTGARLERWEKILIESLKQCRRLCLPAVSRPVRFDKAMSTTKADIKLLLSERFDAPLMKSVCRTRLTPNSEQRVHPPPRGVALAVGPEGGWAKEEEAFAESCGFHVVSMGEGILRAETAAIAALVIAQYEFGT
jgi:16S rRNA (uracil1498-N3)-methyltransferase